MEILALKTWVQPAWRGVRESLRPFRGISHHHVLLFKRPKKKRVLISEGKIGCLGQIIPSALPSITGFYCILLVVFRCPDYTLRIEFCFALFCFFTFGLYHVARGMLAPRPESEPALPTTEAWSLKRWATREVTREF